MTSKDVEEILRGSAEIDRMRRETKQFVTLVLGLVVETAGPFPKDYGWEFFTPSNIRWVLYGRKGCQSLGAAVYLPISDYHELTDTELHKVRAEYAQALYDSLPFFLEAMQKEYGGLERALAPLRDAAGTVR